MGGRRPLWLAALATAAMAGCGGGASSPSTRSTTAGRPKPALTKLVARDSQARLPQPLSGEAVVGTSAGVTSIGGVDAGDISTTSVVAVPARGRPRPDGSLAEPLHDAAAAVVGGHTLVFGGGAATELDSVEALHPGTRGAIVGRLPSARSDLSAVTIDGRAYVLGGFDGSSTIADVLATAHGSSFRRIASLQVPVRYAAVASLGSVIYAFGGELASGADSDAVQAIDVASGRARIVAHLPAATAHASAIALGGRVFVLGGRVAGATSDRVLAFDPATHRLRPAGRLPYPVQNAAAATSGGVGYLVGGLDASGAPLDSIVTLRLVAR